MTASDDERPRYESIADEERPLLRISTQSRPLTFYSTSTPYIEYTTEQQQDDHGVRWRYENYTTIDWTFSLVQERKRLKQLSYLASKVVHENQRWSFWERIYHRYYFKMLKYVDSWQGWIVLTLVGMASAVIATFLDFFIPRLESIRIGYCSTIYLPKSTCEEFITWKQVLGGGFYFIWIVSALLFGLISTLVVEISSSHDITALAERQSRKRHYHATGSGIPEVKTILGGFVIRGFLGVRTLLTKTISLLFSISAGFMVGVQGPLVHICCAIGNVTTRLFSKYRNNDAKRREILSAACAGGVSVAFGAPMGGVLFSLEEVSMYFPPKTMWRSFYCALIGSITLKLLNGGKGENSGALFQIEFDADWNWFEIPVFIMLGVLGGLLGAFFIRVVDYVHLKKKSVDRYTSILY
jgi:chloride channel 3/4/5